MSYKSIKENVIETIVINKSEFISHLFKCQSQDEAEQIISAISEKYSDANHNCYAYVIGKNKNIKKCSDDGEPSQTAGMPILNVLEHNDITDVVCVVTRYFGGIKLGAGGLVRAYSKSCTTALDSAVIITKVAASVCEIHMDYKLAPKVEYFLNDHDIMINSKNYYDKVIFTISVANTVLASVNEYIINASSNQAIFEIVDSTYLSE